MKTKKLLLFSISIMLVALALHGTGDESEEFLSDAWGSACGPCVSSSACGGVPGSNNCAYNNGCSGYCTASCPSGQADKFCIGTTSNPCTISMVDCSQITSYMCVAGLSLYSCKCELSGHPGWCQRQNC